MSDFYQVSRADLEAINRAMNHMGDVLNGMDAVEEEDEAATEAGFKAIQAILASHPSNAVQDAPKNTPVAVLTAAQLAEALEFIAPDMDADQLESEASIYHGEGHSGRGYYCAIADYPDEGSIFLDGSTIKPREPAATVPPVVQAPIPEILFDGYAVYSELTEKERADVVPKSVANVLDAIVRIMRRNAAPAAIDVRPVAWFTDDHLTDKSATTYDSAVRDRWIAKGWAVHPLYATSTAIDVQNADDTPYPFLPPGFLIDKVGDSYVARHPATASESQPYPTRQAATACAWADYALQLDRALQSTPQTGKEVES